MAARNAYILSALAHLVALSLLFLTAQMAPPHVRPLRRYQPVRLVALPGPPATAAKPEPKAESSAKRIEKPVQQAKPKARPAPKTETKSKPEVRSHQKESAGTEGKQEAAKEAGKTAETGGGGGVRLEGAPFPYPYYLSNVQIKILSNFKPTVRAKEAKELDAVVFFLVQRDGRITDVKLEKKSGHFLFDQEAQRAVMRSNPLPALPPAFGSDQLGVHFEFVGSQ